MGHIQGITYQFQCDIEDKSPMQSLNFWGKQLPVLHQFGSGWKGLDGRIPTAFIAANATCRFGCGSPVAEYPHILLLIFRRCALVTVTEVRGECQSPPVCEEGKNAATIFQLNGSLGDL